MQRFFSTSSMVLILNIDIDLPAWLCIARPIWRPQIAVTGVSDSLIGTSLNLLEVLSIKQPSRLNSTEDLLGPELLVDTSIQKSWIHGSIIVGRDPPIKHRHTVRLRCSSTLARLRWPGTAALLYNSCIWVEIQRIVKHLISIDQQKTSTTISTMPNPSVVIVPGAWHRPAHFQGLIDELAKVNYDAVGVTMPSVDSSPPLPSWDQDAQAVRQVIMERLDAGKEVVVLAHSFGGIAMSEAAKGLGKKERAAQGLQGGIVKLMYMCSMALPKGQSHIGQLTPQTPEEEEIEKQRQELEAKFGGMEITADGALKLPKDNVHLILYNRCEPKDIERAVELLGTFPAGPLSVPVTYTAYREIPSTYIVCKNDLALRLPYQRRMIAQGEGCFDVEECDEGHSPWMSKPQFIVDCVRRAAGERN